MIYTTVGIPWITICLPGSLLSLCAGVVFTEAFGPVGIIAAWLVGIFNHFIAGQISFYIARFLLYGVLRQYFESQKILKSIEGALNKSGYKISFLLRFAAFFPYMVLNYGLSVTSITPGQYMFGFIGGWPWELVMVYYGYCIGDVLNILNGTYSAGAQEDFMLICSVILTIGVSIYVLVAAYREINRISEADGVAHVEMLEEVKFEQKMPEVKQSSG